MTKQQLLEQDLAHIWHPCTQMHDHQSTFPLIPIKRAKGVYLYDFDEKQYIDCISSWWVNLFGHCNEYINQKLQEQLSSLEHCIFAGFSHKQAITLSQRLCAKLPKSLNKCFYADNGSSAIEVALKMAFHAKLLRDSAFSKSLEHDQESGTFFLSLQNSYHGESLGALSVSDVGLYKRTYEPLLLRNLTIPMPHTLSDYQEVCTTAPDSKLIAHYEQSLSFLESTLKHSTQIVALILEPLIQCAGGMQIHAPYFVKEALRLCHEYNVYVIFDEIAVGFGRSGSMFALEQCSVTPDFLALSKGITGGYLPLSVVLTNDQIYELFYAPYQENKAFLHSHSYTGNALACACANAVLDIFETQNILETNKHKSRYIWQNAQSLQKFAFIKNLRQMGMVCAFELDSINTRKGIEIYNKALELGLILRPLGNTIYFMPPFIINNEQIDYVFVSLQKIFENLSGSWE